MQVVNKAASVIIYMLKGVHMHGAERHMWGCDTHRKKKRQAIPNRSRSLGGRDLAHWISDLRQSCFLSVPFSPRAPGALAHGFPQNKPPTGCLSRPLINPSVGSLLRSQPSEQGSNPAKKGWPRADRPRRRVKFCFIVLVLKRKKLFCASQLQSKCKNISKVTFFFSFLFKNLNW